jgi:hypothetical protein
MSSRSQRNKKPSSRCHQMAEEILHPSFNQSKGKKSASRIPTTYDISNYKKRPEGPPQLPLNLAKIVPQLCTSLWTSTNVHSNSLIEQCSVIKIFGQPTVLIISTRFKFMITMPGLFEQSPKMHKRVNIDMSLNSMLLLYQEPD